MTLTPEEEKIREYLKKTKMGKRMYKSRVNVGIFPYQYEKIVKLVLKGKYPSINHFVIEAVDKKLKGGENEDKL